uniref:Ubiquitin-like domain-containing protein n=1 Tax=Aegilops tauschii TaxID=37682 RepID=M8BI40_AEGTA
MVKIPSPRRLFRSRSRSTAGGIGGVDMCAMVAEHERIEWEVRPGGMLVQKRRGPDDDAVVEAILVKVCTAGGAWQHDVSIDATATFGDLQRDDGDHLHMAGVQDKDKVLLLEDPAVTERKLRSTSLAQLMGVPCHSFIQV